MCILSVLAQCAIDNAKRKYDVDLSSEIRRISADMNIAENGLPKFWQITKKDKRKCRNDEQRLQRQRENKDKIKERINEELVCPMNYLYDIKLNKYNKVRTIPNSEFFINHPMDQDRRKCKKVEEIIEKYALKLHIFHINDESTWNEGEDIIVLEEEFYEMIEEIKKVYVSNNYLGLMSWLINRTLFITSSIKGLKEYTNSNLYKNRPILLKTLYTVNPTAFLNCFKTQ